MPKIKITQISTGNSKVVSPEDAEAIKANPFVAKRYKIEEQQTKPSEPAIVDNEAPEVKTTEGKKSSKPTNK